MHFLVSSYYLRSENGAAKSFWNRSRHSGKDRGKKSGGLYRGTSFAQGAAAVANATLWLVAQNAPEEPPESSNPHGSCGTASASSDTM
jgi:hypothetical protein